MPPPMSPADHLGSGFPSDLRSDEEEEVDAIVSQALDDVALEQIAALNTAHLLPPSSSALPLPVRHLNSPPQPFPPLSPPPPKASVTPIVPDPQAPSATPHSPSPPRQRRGCCFGFSPRGGRKDAGGKARTALEEGWGKEGEELLEEVRGFSFSTKEQRKKMKEAMREVEKASRETEKLTELARELSIRMDFAAGLDGLVLSDDDVEEFK